MSKILLVDVDSRISNLALMKLSNHHKKNGDEVRLYDHRPTGRAMRKSVPLDLIGWPDEVLASCVFSWNREIAKAVSGAFLAPKVTLSGQGVNYGRLSPEIDALTPDYSLYPNEHYAVGFCNRGCFRKCSFCSVPKLEGAIVPERFRHPSEWVPDGMSAALLLDNEFADYLPETQAELIGWFQRAGVKYALTQGYDLRILARHPEYAQVLAAYKPWDTNFQGRRIYCAWDFLGVELAVRRGVQALLDAGFRKGEITPYILIGFNTTHEQDEYRFNVLWREYGIRPYAMRYNERRDDPWLNRFARFCNRPAFRNVEWSDFSRNL